MVVEGDVEETGGCKELTCELEIGSGGGGIAAGVVVHEDEAVGTVFDGRVKDLSGVGEHFGEGADGDALRGDQAVFHIEEDNDEDLLGLVCEVGPHHLIGIFSSDDLSAARLSAIEAFEGDAKGGFEPDRFGLPDPFKLHKLLNRGVEKRRQSLKVRDELLRKGKNRLPFRAGREENSNELRESEGVHAAALQALTGPLIFR